MNKLSLFLLVAVVLLLTACSDDNKAWEPDNPINTTSLMKHYANQNNYEEFKSLLLKGYDEEHINRMYETVREATSDNAEIRTFTFITFDNGKSLLVDLTTPASKDEKVLIQDIIEIPTEMAKFIDKELNKKFEK